VLVALAPSAGRAQFPPVGAQAQCQKLGPLLQEREKRGRALQEASKRKGSPQEGCRLIKAFQANETELIKFIEANGQWCGLPPDALAQLKASAAQTAQVRGNVCAAAAGPPPPKPPTLGEVLGTTRVPDATTTRTGRGGAFDTLTGNPIAR
jgi:hypothetical protein